MRVKSSVLRGDLLSVLTWNLNTHHALSLLSEVSQRGTLHGLLLRRGLVVREGRLFGDVAHLVDGRKVLLQLVQHAHQLLKLLRMLL